MKYVRACNASPHSYERANTYVEWISTLPQRDTVFPSYIPYSISADLPVGIGLALWLFHLLLPVIGLLLVVGLVLFIIRAIGPRNSGTTWNSLWNTGYQ